MKISIIIPNFNGITILRDCLHSLLNHDRKPEEIIVVDNGSTDGSVDAIRAEFPSVILLALNSNTGFTGANNAGMRASSGDLLVLLNNDCIVEDNWLNSLCTRMQENDVAAVTSSMRNIKDVNIIDSAGGQFDWMGFSRDVGKGEPASLHDRTTEIPFPCGGAVMIRKNALPSSEVLFWNELFIYQEDLDLGLELWRTGWRVVYEPEAIVRHMHSATMSKFSSFKEQLCVRNRLLVLRKHFDRETFSAAAPVLKRWQYLWILSSMAKGRISQAIAVLKGTRAGFTMPVDRFSAAAPVNDVFRRFAKSTAESNPVKARMYAEIRRIIHDRASSGR